MRWILLAVAAAPGLAGAADGRPKELTGGASAEVSGRVAASGYAAADLTGMTVSVRYKLWPMLGEPVELFLLKYEFSDRASVDLIPKDANKPRWSIRSEPTMVAGTVKELAKSDERREYAVAPDVFRQLSMSDPWFRLSPQAQPREHYGVCIIRKNPGALSRAGRWSFDVAGSPNWGRMFQKYYSLKTVMPLAAPFPRKVFEQEEHHYPADLARPIFKEFLDTGTRFTDLGVYGVELLPGDLIYAIERGGITPKPRDPLDDAINAIDDPKPREPQRRDVMFYLTASNLTEEEREKIRQEKRVEQAAYDRIYDREYSQYRRELAAWEQRRKERGR